MIKILIVDDHAIIGGGLKQFLANAGGFEVAGQARSGAEAIAMLESQRWDLVVLDLGLPDMSGIELLKHIKREQPEMRVLVFSMSIEADVAMQVLEAGAAGYLPKDSAPEEILAAIRRASAGERYLSPKLVDQLLSGSVPRSGKLPHDTLSVREFEVMRMLSLGVPLTAIGERLHLSPKTVSTYRSRILEKLGVHNNAAITRYVLEYKLGL